MGAARILRSWTAINRMARARYRALLVRHPALARRLRAVFLPALLRTNRLLLGRSFPDFSTAVVDDALRGRFQPVLPARRLRVSVIVPCYNHATFLPRRLQSIADQTRPADEIILLDDASTDGSADLLREAAATPGARLIVNAQNSGSPFAQWQRGIAAATGDLVWIAESDDWAAPDFLARLVPMFDNPAVTLVFGRAVFMDAEGRHEVARMEDQLPEGADPSLYAEGFVMPGFEAVRRGFAAANLIPTASAALFRRPADLASTELATWSGMRICGDWVLWLALLRGGMLAYDPGARAFWRIHGASSSGQARAGDGFYREHLEVARIVARHYGMSRAEMAALRARLAHLWRAARNEPVSRLDALLPDEAILAEPRRIRLLIAGAGFSGGGAEVFAITLANLMARAGHSVAFLDMQIEPDGPLRDRLDPDIPILSDPRALSEIVRRFGIDVVHSHHPWADQQVIETDIGQAARVATLHGMYETLPARERAALLGRLTARADAITATAPRNLAGLADHAGQVIENAVAPWEGSPADRESLGIPAGAFLVTVASRAVEGKGWTEAVAAVGAARRISGLDIRLLLVGDGPVRDRLAAGGVPDFVRMPGFRSDVPALFAASDLALLPTTFAGESAPLSILEALEARVPVLATDLGQIPAMVGAAGETIAIGERGLDPEALGQRLAALVMAPGRLAAMRAAMPPRGLAADRMVARYESVYRAAMDRAKAR